MDLSGLPPQPGEERWRFRDELRAPLWIAHGWKRGRPGSGQRSSRTHADLSAGVHLAAGFEDPRGRLHTANRDLAR